MKKIIYILVITIGATLTFSGCTEEDVNPKLETAGGGHVSDPA